MGTSEQPPPRHLTPLESVYRDNVSRERSLLADHPDWTIRRVRDEGTPQTAPITYEASNGVVTLTSDDLGAILDMIERNLSA